MSKRTTRILSASALMVAGLFVTSCGGDSGGGSKSAGDFCEYLKVLDESDPMGDISETSTPEDIEAAFTEIESTINDLYEAAPEEIRADIKVVQETYSQMIDLFESANWDATAIDFDAFQAIDTADADAATERLDTWETTNCK